MRIWRGGSPGSGPVGGGRGQAAREAGVGGQAHEHSGGGLRGRGRRWRTAQQAPGRGVGGGDGVRGRRGTERRWWTRAAVGSARRVVRLGLVVNGPEHGNREKLIFDDPLGFRHLIN
jgi:hypothetical protein